MGSQVKCCGCWSAMLNELSGRRRTRTVRRAKYNEREYSIEFENLIEEDDFYAPPQHAVSEIEKDLLNKGKFDELFQHQKNIHLREDEYLRQKEEAVRMEDEAFIQAKREASRVSKQKRSSQIPFDKSKLPNMKNLDHIEFSKWLSEENIDVTSPDFNIDDFDSFLEKMRAKANSEPKKEAEKSLAWEQTMSRGLEATKIAGDALNALKPVELHAVPLTSAQAAERSVDSVMPDIGFSSSSFVNSHNVLSRNTSGDGRQSSSEFGASNDFANFEKTNNASIHANSFTTQALISSPPPLKDSDFVTTDTDFNTVMNNTDHEFSTAIQSNSLQSKLSFADSDNKTPPNKEESTITTLDFSSEKLELSQTEQKNNISHEKLVELNDSHDDVEDVTKSNNDDTGILLDASKTLQQEDVGDIKKTEGWSDAESDFDFDGDFVSSNTNGGFEDMI